MEELIRKLETATEGNRLLDRDIFLAANPDWLERGIELSDETIPKLSTSLDAALTLVPDAHEWTVGVDLENRNAIASVGNDVWDEAFDLAIGRARTPALALCIAALRARQQ